MTVLIGVTDISHEFDSHCWLYVEVSGKFSFKHTELLMIKAAENALNASMFNLEPGHHLI